MILAYRRYLLNLLADEAYACLILQQCCQYSVVTVRRYMAYLSESGKVLGDMDYEIGGRPCMKYQMK